MHVERPGATGGTLRAPRVRFLVHGAERSGPPIYVLRLVQHWRVHPAPFELEVVVARPGPLVRRLAAATETSVARLDRRSPERVGAQLLEWVHLPRAGRALMGTAVRSRVGRDQPDLTVVNGATAPTVELLRALAPSGTVVTIAHELSTGWFANLRPCDRTLLRSRTSAYLAVSESVRSFLIEELEVAPEMVTVVPPPVDVAALESVRADPDGADPDRAGPALVVGSGVTDWRKAPELWLRVAALVRRHPGHHHVRFAWVGGEAQGSPAFWPLEHEMAQLDLRGRVEFLGTVEEPWRALRGASVMVSTAREDAYPLACAEAIASGVPVVGFDVDGVGEMVRASGCGIVAPYPDEAALADAAVQLLDDRALRASMAERGRRFAERELDVPVVAPRVAAWIMEHAA